MESHVEQSFRKHNVWYWKSVLHSVCIFSFLTKHIIIQLCFQNILLNNNLNWLQSGCSMLQQNLYCTSMCTNILVCWSFLHYVDMHTSFLSTHFMHILMVFILSYWLINQFTANSTLLTIHAYNLNKQTKMHQTWNVSSL
jgi:hypothetical protein